MINPTDDDIGRQVIYRRTGEWGVITSFNEHMVFVRYGSDQGSMGTRRCDLDWAHGKIRPEHIRGEFTRSKPVNYEDEND